MYSWQVQVMLVSTGVDSVTFDLDWQRSESTGGHTRFAAADHRTITIRQNDRHVFDFVACSPADSSVANMIFEVQAWPVEDAKYSGVSLGYDMWLVQQADDGTKTIRRAKVLGRQGERVPFKFFPVSLPLNQQVPADADSPFKMYLEGTIAGRVAPDGNIQVALQPQRSYRFPGEGGGTCQGFTSFVVKPEETISLDLPSEGGHSTWRPDNRTVLSNLRAGVTMVENGRVRIDYGQYFADAKTSIILTASRETESIGGKWHLVDYAADETKTPEHGMYLAIYAEDTGYRGIILNFATGEERLPLKAVQYDGVTLRLQLTARSGNSQAEMPWLLMTLNNGRFEGYYMNSANKTTGPKLKLIRAR